MAYHSTSGTAANNADFASRLRDFLVTTGVWRLHDSGSFSPTVPWWVLASSGESGAEEIYVMLVDDAWASRLSLRVFQYWDPVAHAPVGEAWDFDFTYVNTAATPFLYWIYADLDHFFVVTKLGASYFGQYTGLLRRFWSGQMATTQAPATAGENVVIEVDDASVLTSPEYYIIQDHQYVERVRVIGRDTSGTPHTVTVETLANAYETGARIGEDPQPLIVGRSNSPGGFYAVSRFDGYASQTGQAGACYLADGGARPFSDPDARYGRHMLFPWLAAMTGDGAQELRGELIEVYGLAKADWTRRTCCRSAPPATRCSTSLAPAFVP